ncbi:MAG: phosphoesterase PA-phosphatase related [Ilumatobacteraceae bacterium]|nr:phosphoesterase PA-phosphatase related [Ilumatobacteraceae bacterium]
MIASETQAPTTTEHPLLDELRRAVPLLVVVPAMILALWGAGVMVIHSRIDDWDLHFDKWLAARRTPWLNTATEWGTYLAETIPVIIILLAAMIIARRRTGNWRASVFLAVVVGGEKLVYFASSTLVARARPPLPTLDNTYATSSFPSGHVGSAITLYAAIAIVVGAWRGRRWFIALMTVMVVFACIVAFSRMYRGFHYPSDVIAGAIVGTVWVLASLRVLRPIRHD